MKHMSTLFAVEQKNELEQNRSWTARKCAMAAFCVFSWSSRSCGYSPLESLLGFPTNCWCAHNIHDRKQNPLLKYPILRLKLWVRGRYFFLIKRKRLQAAAYGNVSSLVAAMACLQSNQTQMACGVCKYQAGGYPGKAPSRLDSCFFTGAH